MWMVYNSLCQFRRDYSTRFYTLALSLGFGGNPLLALNALAVAKTISLKEENRYGEVRISK